MDKPWARYFSIWSFIRVMKMEAPRRICMQAVGLVLRRAVLLCCAACYVGYVALPPES
jgi:hypothetical protein